MPCFGVKFIAIYAFQFDELCESPIDDAVVVVFVVVTVVFVVIATNY